MHLDARIGEVASQQLGLLTMEQFVAVGGTPDSLRSRVRRQTLMRVAPRVYRIAGVPMTWRTELLARLLSLGDGAVISDLAAAALHGFDGFDPGPLEFTTSRNSRARAVKGTVHKRRPLRRIDVMVVDDLFTCTTASRTIIDLAGTSISEARLEAAIDSAIRDG